MKWILQLLGGSGGGWILLAGLLAATAAGGSAGYVARGVIDAPQLAQLRTDVQGAKNETLTCQRDREKDRADGNAKVTADLQRQVQRLSDIISDLEKAKAARDAATAKYLAELSRIPASNVCGGSAPERFYRNSVQPRRPAVP
jgi:hypothetical protein